MDNKSKQVLRKLVEEIEDLRADVLAVAAHPSLKMSIADAHKNKVRALRTHEEHYKNLRKKIESL